MQLELPDFATARVLVVGDVMLDRYWHGLTRRISPEAPVPVMRVDGEDIRPGGAANVAMNLGALGVDVRLMGITGDDDHGRLLEAALREGGVDPWLRRVDTHPTICKLRVLSQRQQLIRLDFERPFSASETQGLIQDFRKALAEADIVIISDYAKGTLFDVESLIAAARDVPVPILVDPKGTDWQRYAGATLLTPNLGELRQYRGSRGGAGPVWEAEVWDRHNLEALVPPILSDLSLGGMLVTRGEAGMSLFRAESPTFHLPAHAQEVFNVT